MSPNPVENGAEYQIVCTGFTPDRWVTVGATFGDWVYWVSGLTNAVGSVTLSSTARGVGDILHTAKEQSRLRFLRDRASATLTVI